MNTNTRMRDVVVASTNVNMDINMDIDMTTLVNMDAIDMDVDMATSMDIDTNNSTCVEQSIPCNYCGALFGFCMEFGIECCLRCLYDEIYNSRVTFCYECNIFIVMPSISTYPFYHKNCRIEENNIKAVGLFVQKYPVPQLQDHNLSQIFKFYMR